MQIWYRQGILWEGKVSLPINMRRSKTLLLNKLSLKKGIAVAYDLWCPVGRSLSYNSITELPDGVFSSLTKLETL